MGRSLHNTINKKKLRVEAEACTEKRYTLSFYRYLKIEDPQAFRDELYTRWEAFKVFGRIYVAHEGINAQLSVPQDHYDLFEKDCLERFPSLHIKKAIEENSVSFSILKIKVKEKILADGLSDDSFDVTNTGRHLSAKEFNRAMDKEDSIVVDLRNHYESEVGHFKGAICPDVDTFRDELPLVLDLLKDKKDKKLLLYCTGGIRCEKASAYFKHKGFQDVNQLEGGIIHYKEQIDNEGLENKYIGKNFVFDHRMGERISDDVIATCHQCEEPCDTHVNCANDACHLLFIQCPSCSEKFHGCCSKTCADMIQLPEDEQKKLRTEGFFPAKTKNRLRPKLKEYLEAHGLEKE
jgi:UPF0176 protein